MSNFPAQVPQFPYKWDKPALIEPPAFLEYMRSIGRFPTVSAPRALILCYQDSIFQWVKKTQAHTPGDGFAHNVLLLNDFAGEIAVSRVFGIGAPAAVALLEEMIAWGVQKVISIGTAGSLQKNVGIGDLIICDRALRDEGTSHHYLSPSRFARANDELTDKLAEQMRSQQILAHRGAVWTIDAVYRETVAEAQAYQAEGLLGVEMEAAALFAVAERRGVPLATLLCVSDSLADLRWHPEFHSTKIKTGLQSLFKVVVGALK